MKVNQALIQGYLENVIEEYLKDYKKRLNLIIKIEIVFFFYCAANLRQERHPSSRATCRKS